mgnify:CR=1 FL=1
MLEKYYFTITAGRTGTSWLREFITRNLEINCVHESLGIDDFGVKMPDIKTMRSFNDRGLDKVVRSFWKKKFKSIDMYEKYAETNHTLAKCGLVESLTKWKHVDQTKVIILRRENKLNQCASYIERHDFTNITIDWQWYLSFYYKNVIVNPKPFVEIGYFGRVIWYVYEVECRQEYYRQLYSDKIDFVEATLEDVTTQKGADYFLKQLGSDKKAIIFGKKNASKTNIGDEKKEEIAFLLERINIDVTKVVSNYISSGTRLSFENETCT